MSAAKPEAILDPSGRFEKIEHPFAALSNVICSKGYDTENGLEVSWYEINCHELNENIKVLLEERTRKAMSLKITHILSIFTYWFNQERTVFNIITENVNTKSIFSYIGEYNSQYKPKSVQKWAMPVLQGLEFLHSQNPPFVHLRVDLSSIFIKPSSKLVKLKPPLLNPYILLDESHDLNLSFNTPPESIFNNVVPASDIWLLGITILYFITGEQPYSECENPFALLSKLRNFTPPESVNRVIDPYLKDFLTQCFKPTNERPTATQLMSHPFFTQEYTLNINNAPSQNFEILIEQNHNIVSSTDFTPLNHKRAVSKPETELLSLLM